MHVEPKQHPIMQRVLEIATDEVGVKEVGNNGGTRVNQYQETCGCGTGDPWCACFVCWCVETACKQQGIKQPFKFSAYTPELYDTLTKVYSTKDTIRRGDVFFLFSPSMGRISHVGFVASDLNLASGGFRTIEGNSNPGGSREGDGVVKRMRMNSDLILFARITEPQGNLVKSLDTEPLTDGGIFDYPLKP